MRYLNWDVLIFPGDSKVPIQEFRTSCYGVPDPEYHRTSPLPGSLSVLQSNQIPIVTCFIPNQVNGTPFRVSVHSWDVPRMSERQKILAKRGRISFYQARVLIDGVISGESYFGLETNYPQILEKAIGHTKTGGRELLRWPIFHAEQLTQAYWSAQEEIGRIKLLLSEGFFENGLEGQFVRVANIVSFAFQHAPQSILENAGIAWPNRGMWSCSYGFPFRDQSFQNGFNLIDPGLQMHTPPEHQPIPTNDQLPPLPNIQMTQPSTEGTVNYMPPPLPFPSNIDPGKVHMWESVATLPESSNARHVRTNRISEDTDIFMGECANLTSMDDKTLPEMATPAKQTQNSSHELSFDDCARFMESPLKFPKTNTPSSPNGLNFPLGSTSCLTSPSSMEKWQNPSLSGGTTNNPQTPTMFQTSASLGPLTDRGVSARLSDVRDSEPGNETKTQTQMTPESPAPEALEANGTRGGEQRRARRSSRVPAEKAPMTLSKNTPLEDSDVNGEEKGASNGDGKRKRASLGLRSREVGVAEESDASPQPRKVSRKETTKEPAAK